MARRRKKGSGLLEGALVVGGVAGVGMLLYGLFSGGRSSSADTDLPPSTRRISPVARGPKYQGWLNTISGLNRQFLSGTINLQTLQAKLAQVKDAVYQDYPGGLTYEDLNDIKNDIEFYGG